MGFRSSMNHPKEPEVFFSPNGTSMALVPTRYAVFKPTFLKCSLKPLCQKIQQKRRFMQKSPSLATTDTSPMHAKMFFDHNLFFKTILCGNPEIFWQMLLSPVQEAMSRGHSFWQDVRSSCRLKMRLWRDNILQRLGPRIPGSSQHFTSVFSKSPKHYTTSKI